MNEREREYYASEAKLDATENFIVVVTDSVIKPAARRRRVRTTVISAAVPTDLAQRLAHLAICIPANDIDAAIAEELARALLKIATSKTTHRRAPARPSTAVLTKTPVDDDVLIVINC